MRLKYFIMKKRTKRNYAHTHKIAKIILCLFNTALLVFATTYDITTLLILMNFTYFFGVNSIAYLLEVCLHLKHKHDKI